MQRAGPAWAWDAYKLSEPLILRQWYPVLRLGRRPGRVTHPPRCGAGVTWRDVAYAFVRLRRGSGPHPPTPGSRAVCKPANFGR